VFTTALGSSPSDTRASVAGCALAGFLQRPAHVIQGVHTVELCARRSGKE
jgi:hypothetical protein